MRSSMRRMIVAVVSAASLISLVWAGTANWPHG
jgi:hypothetical protein